MEAFEILSQRRDSESCGDASWERLVKEPEDLSDSEPVSCELVRVVPDVSDVIDVLVSPSSVVTELCDVSPCCSDWELVEPQSFSFIKQRAHRSTDTQAEMRYEGSPVLTPSRRRMTPPTPPVQISYTSFVRDDGRLRRGRKRMECERKNNHCEDKTKRQETSKAQDLRNLQLERH